MPMFSEAAVTSQGPLISSVPKCGACKLYKRHDCISPKMPVAGLGKKKIMIIGEAPGETEDKKGKPFVGNSGDTLREILEKLNINLHRDCWRTNSIICRPVDNDNKNRKPTLKEIEFCRPNAVNAIKKHKPHLILLLGGSAVESIIPYSWKTNDAVGNITRWRGWQIPCATTKAYICPTYHPSFVIGSDGDNYPIPRMLFEQDITEAISCLNNPMVTPSNWEAKVKNIYDSYAAAKIIDQWTSAGGIISLDYETNMLKPDSPWSQIVCGAISNGKAAVAFPWSDNTKQAVSRLITAKNVKLVGANIMFEDRWNLAKLGHAATNWKWDTMQFGHVMDNRKAPINSVKFQSYVLLGMPLYNEWIKPYLESDAPDKRNNIHKLQMKDLHTYCGLDAILEWHIARVQSKKIGIPI